MEGGKEGREVSINFSLSSLITTSTSAQQKERTTAMVAANGELPTDLSTLKVVELKASPHLSLHSSLSVAEAYAYSMMMRE